MRPEREISASVLRARQTAALARGSLALSGIALAVFARGLDVNQTLAVIGFVTILLTALVQLILPSPVWLKVEESCALPAILIIGLGDERVNILSLLWLAAVACGVLARGGRVHWVGRFLVLGSLALPVILHHRLTLQYAGLCLATVALLLTCGRVTQELRALLVRARYEADHDGLTGALARSAFRLRLDGVAGQASPRENVALLVLDLDNFGQVNKSHGHAAGDAVLRTVVGGIRDRVGREGIVGRLGGDEFAVIVRDLDARALAEELTADFQDPGPGIVPIASSVGVARIPTDGNDAETLLRAADVALRVAKQGRRRHVSFYVGEPLSDEGPGGARAALDRLIAGEGLSVVVQPVVDLTSGLAHAFEALARFPAGGPLHWLSLAEEFGLRAELELACLRAALGLLDELPAGALLSANLSGPLLLDPRTHDVLGAEPSVGGLILEITENSLVEDTTELHAAITALLEAGVRFAFDDMGAGYSGLRQITTLHARYLKLDRSLITNIEANAERCALVSALLGYSGQTDSLLVAEGVETAAELATLKGLGVPLAQGFYLGRPASPWPPTDASLVTGRTSHIEPGQLPLVGVG